MNNDVSSHNGSTNYDENGKDIMNSKRLGLQILSLLLTVLSMTFGSIQNAHAKETEKHYVNLRYGVSIEYPDIFWSRFESENGDGIRFKTANGQCELAVWGEMNIFNRNNKTQLESRLKESAHIVPNTATTGHNWYTFTTTDDGGFNGVEHYILEYGIVNPDALAVFSFTYPAKAGFEPIVEHLKKTLQFGGDRFDDLTQFNLLDWSSEYSLDPENKHILRSINDATNVAGTAQTANSDMGTYFWFPVSPRINDVMQGSQPGIYFYYENGRFISFLPTQKAEFTGDVHINPSATQFLIDFGTAPERDLELYDFRTLKKSKSFLIINSATWLDDSHFVTTLVDTSKTKRSNNATESGWLSVIVYDTNTGTIKYIRQATNTSDFLLDNINTQAHQLTIQEQNVLHPHDWDNDNAIKSKTSTVNY